MRNIRSVIWRERAFRIPTEAAVIYAGIVCCAAAMVIVVAVAITAAS